MAKLPSSIFNDVIGPVMVGPSSSHTAGPARIGFLAGQLGDGKLSRVKMTFETNGSFAMTYKGQKSDQGLAAGLMGMPPHDSRLSDALSLIKSEGIEVSFEVKDFDASHPNTVLLEIVDEHGGTVSASGLSVGGGCIELNEINGCSVSLTGDYFELVIMQSGGNLSALEGLCADVEALLREADVAVHGHSVSDNGNSGAWQGVIVIHTRQQISEELLEKVRLRCGGTGVRLIAPVMPVLASSDCKVPFTRAAEMLKWCVEHDTPLWKVAALYEAARGGLSVAEVLEMMERIIRAMEESVRIGMIGDFTMKGFLTPSAWRLRDAVMDEKFIPSGMLDMATVMSVTELNAAMGCVVAAPTAGSCGVLPAAVFSMLDQLDIPQDARVETAAKAMLVAGLIGVFINEQATFAAEVCGCQAECGSAASMAAAALVELAGGSPEAACNAAAFAMQNSLGLICDPVAEQVEVPCISRNVAAVSNAVTAANLAMFGFRGTLPLDEVIGAMWEVGNMLPDALRCTGKGGLCMTPSGVRLKEEVDKRRFGSEE
ncbi:L-serine ammonia-lyase, iron-sulfur-dependent, subunit alpha [Halodesulfovibrio marinisediminis]|uniref:L-serine ammonia-lyase n=1 Tax=Halodesulfovibrio marinisediminis DSM 17456 TaxID=1121457 RepID=A0A1N6I7Y5_9BACT|nr:L-serine ammonia-lyase, iron-sulfur-dependent, subunit alpha [Halodesulfovibrio marinisediminis]SIO28110.1 L-serine dehydratase [Halodesulfovibrio marinisediminis DSM 17456]